MTTNIYPILVEILDLRSSLTRPPPPIVSASAALSWLAVAAIKSRIGKTQTALPNVWLIVVSFN